MGLQKILILLVIAVIGAVVGTPTGIVLRHVVAHFLTNSEGIYFISLAIGGPVFFLLMPLERQALARIEGLDYGNSKDQIGALLQGAPFSFSFMVGCFLGYMISF